MKKYLLTGLITLLPLTLTIIISLYLLDVVTKPAIVHVKQWLFLYEKTQQINLAPYYGIILFFCRLIILALFFVFLIVLGFFTQKFAHVLFTWFGHAMDRIPVVKTIYRLTKEVTEAVFQQDKKTFKATALVPFPHKETYAMGFVTSDVPEFFKKEISNLDYSVFVPTSPHPISGFLVMAEAKDVKPIPVSVEEAIKYLLSCGVVSPIGSKEES